MVGLAPFVSYHRGVNPDAAPRWNWPRLSLVRAMILVGLIAVGLGFLKSWFENDRRIHAVDYAWNGPISIRVSRHDDLETMLKRFALAMGCPKFKKGVLVAVDTGGLHEAGRTLASSIGKDFDVKDMPAREFLEQILKPLGLACKLQERQVMVTSSQSPDEPLEYWDHGEITCGHKDGHWVMIYNGEMTVGSFWN
jgi:hypothetical protein